MQPQQPAADPRAQQAYPHPSLNHRMANMHLSPPQQNGAAPPPQPQYGKQQMIPGQQQRMQPAPAPVPAHHRMPQRPGMPPAPVRATSAPTPTGYAPPRPNMQNVRPPDPMQQRPAPPPQAQAPPQASPQGYAQRPAYQAQQAPQPAQRMTPPQSAMGQQLHAPPQQRIAPPRSTGGAPTLPPQRPGYAQPMPPQQGFPSSQQQQSGMAPPRPGMAPSRHSMSPPQQAQGMPPPRPGMAPPQPGMPRPGITPQQAPRPGMGAPMNSMTPPQSSMAPPQPGMAPLRPGMPPSNMRPGAAPMRPVPPGGPGVGAAPMRPLPPGAAPRAPAMRPMPPGAGNGAPPGVAQHPGMQPQPGMVPGSDQQMQGNGQAPAAQLPSSAMPRPCATESPSGTPRPYFHRSMITNLDQGAGAATIPSSNSDFIAIDDGSASLRYMRLTANSIASEPAVMSKAGVPLAIVMSPFADPAPGESGVPLVDFSQTKEGSPGGGGPLRCGKCNAYANPGFKFLSGGSQFLCNLCGAVTDTPREYYAPISPATGLRVDIEQRHELRYGSVEYLVGNEAYFLRKPKPAAYVYAIDVSASAVQSGLAGAALFSIRLALSAGLLPGAKQGARVAIFTYDDALQFYDARGADDGRSVSIHVVPDVKDPFVPLGGDGFLLTPSEAVAAIDAVVESLGLRQPGTRQPPSAGCALGSALHAIKTALGECGGKAFVIAGGIPSTGIDPLERRGGGAVGGGEERETKLLKPATPNYEILGCELAEKQISVDLFLAPSAAYIDAATLVRVPRACGGRLYAYPGFDRQRDAAPLHRAICTATSSIRAFDALMRVRTSVGLETVGEFVGHFGRPQRGDDISGPVFDATQTQALEISVVSKLSEGSSSGSRAYAGGGGLSDDACVQCAVLFTDPAGQRRIRVHTMFASKTAVLADVFRSADVDATTTFLAKKAASAVFANGTPVSKARDALVEKTVQALFVYRKRCTSSSMSGQLILPEALKTLPVSILGLTKSNAFRSSANAASASEAVAVDDRVAALVYLVQSSVADVAAFAYPRMFDLGPELSEAVGNPIPKRDPPVSDGRSPAAVEPVCVPNTVPLSAATLREDAVLLFENGARLIAWLGDKAPRPAAEDLVAQLPGGRLAIRAETAGSGELMKKAGPRAQRVARVIDKVVRARQYMAAPIVLVGPNARMPGMIEDRAANGQHSYVEFLRFVHKKVMTRLANESAQNDMQTWEMLNHGY